MKNNNNSSVSRVPLLFNSLGFLLNAGTGSRVASRLSSGMKNVASKVESKLESGISNMGQRMAARAESPAPRRIPDSAKAFGAGALAGAATGAMMSPSPRSSISNSGGEQSNPHLWEIIVGVFLIIVQFVLNKGFIGTGYSKYYFDAVFMAFLFLLAVNCRREFLKMFLFLASSIYVSSIVLNHFNIISTLVSLIPISGFRDMGTVLYYCLIIIISAVFARAIIKDDDVDITGYAALAILSIAIPYVLIKINPYSSYLISDAQGGSLIQLFFSIPILWQPFWISGIFKARNNGSKMAKVFSFIWLILLLLIVSIISYFSVPIEARQNIQTSGSNTLTKSADSLQSATNVTIRYIKENLMGIKATDSAAVETEIDSEQKNLDKRFEFRDMKLSEDSINMNMSEALSYFYVTANARMLGVSDFEKYPFDAKVSCYTKILGYKGVFKDPSASSVIVNGSMGSLEADTPEITQKLDKFASANSLSCYFRKQKILDQVGGDNEKMKNYNIRSTSLNMYYNAKYTFVSSAYLKRFFIDRANYEEIMAENRGKISDDYSLLSFLGYPNADKYVRSKYGGGLLKIGIGIQGTDVLVKIDKETKTNNILFSFSASEYAESNTVIKDPEWILIAVPKSIEIGASECSLKFVQVTDTVYLESLKDLIGTVNTADFNYYILRSDNPDLKKFFQIKPGDSAKPISCPVSLPQKKFDIVRIDVFVKYAVEYSRSISAQITT